jgi:integrase/recombinase XerD
MSALSDALDDYLRLRRSLGYKLDRGGQVLADFVAYSDAAGADHIRTDLAVSWALRTPNPDSPWRAGRLGAVRCFARYLQALDPVHEIPPPGLIPRGRGRPVPRLFTKEQVAALMSAARRLRTPLQAATVETVVGLLWATGLRVGEVIRLDDTDLDADNALLMVRGSKNGRSRTIPIDCTTADALRSYVGVRNRLVGEPNGDSLFVSTVGRRLSSGNLGTAFASVVELAGLSTQGESKGLRLGGLRHSFAVQSLLEWHLAGLDVGALLPRLSTYMGHVSPASTYWYLSASSELLRAAAGRIDGVAPR